MNNIEDKLKEILIINDNFTNSDLVKIKKKLFYDFTFLFYILNTILLMYVLYISHLSFNTDKIYFTEMIIVCSLYFFATICLTFLNIKTSIFIIKRNKNINYNNVYEILENYLQKNNILNNFLNNKDIDTKEKIYIIKKIFYLILKYNKKKDYKNGKTNYLIFFKNKNYFKNLSLEEKMLFLINNNFPKKNLKYFMII